MKQMDFWGQPFRRGRTLEKGHYPLLEGGVVAPREQMERYLRFGATGEVKHLLRQAF
jgi:hypothetical protein